MEAEEWLEAWVDANIESTLVCEDKSDMEREAAVCMDDAQKAGISAEDLLAAAGDDLEAYLCRAQNAITNAHIERKD